MKYGLAASVWSSNVGRVHRVAQSLEVSISGQLYQWTRDRDGLWHLCLLVLGWHSLV